MEVIHAAIAVSTLEYSLTFYVDGLGLTNRWGFERDEVRHRYLGGTAGAEIQLVDDPDVDEPSPSGIDHVAVEVTDLNETFKTLEERTSCPVVSAPSALEVSGVESRYAFVKDPDGYLIELVERSPNHPANEWK